jgi:hypothetical protein
VTSPAGGSATAFVNVVGAHTVDATAAATGGAGGTNSAGGAAAGGNATATAIAKGNGLSVDATAHGGTGGTVAGSALADATGTGISGTVTAVADTHLIAGNLVTGVSAKASSPVNSASTAEARAVIAAGSVPGFVTGDQSIAMIDGNPDSKSLNAVFASNPNIAMVCLGATAEFALGELGGAYAGTNILPQTQTASFSETIELTTLTSKENLLVGFYNGTQQGKGITDLTLDITANGANLLHQHFTDSASAMSFFTDHALLLAAVSTFGNTLNLGVSLSTTENKTGAGLEFGMVIVNGSSPLIF